MKQIKDNLILFIGIILICSFFSYNTIDSKESPKSTYVVKTAYNKDMGVSDYFQDWDYCGLDAIICNSSESKTFTITAYNTTFDQCDSTPCISASGDNICGRSDVVACSREYEFGTMFEIDGRRYVCLDRLAPKYNDRLDISFDKDVLGAKQFGKQIKVAYIIDK